MDAIKCVQLLFLASLCCTTFCWANRLLTDDTTHAKHLGDTAQSALTGDCDDCGGDGAGSGSDCCSPGQGQPCCNQPGSGTGGFGGCCGEIDGSPCGTSGEGGGNPPSGGSCGGTCCAPPQSVPCPTSPPQVPCPINCGQPGGGFAPNMVMWTYAWPPYTTMASQHKPKQSNNDSKIKQDFKTLGKGKHDSGKKHGFGHKKPGSEDDNAVPVKN